MAGREAERLRAYLVMGNSKQARDVTRPAKIELIGYGTSFTFSTSLRSWVDRGAVHNLLTTTNYDS